MQMNQKCPKRYTNKILIASLNCVIYKSEIQSDLDHFHVTFFVINKGRQIALSELVQDILTR